MTPMNDHTLSTLLCQVDTPAGLYAKVLARVRYHTQMRARARSIALGAVALVSGAALVPAVQYVGQELYASGFYEYISLALSDRTIFFTLWREIVLSLVESLPSFALLVLIAAGVALAWSLKRAVANVRIGFLPTYQS